MNKFVFAHIYRHILGQLLPKLMVRVHKSMVRNRMGQVRIRKPEPGHSMVPQVLSGSRSHMQVRCIRGKLPYQVLHLLDTLISGKLQVYSYQL